MYKRQTVQVFGSEALQSVGMSIDFDLENPKVAEFLNEKPMKFAREINETTLKQLRKNLVEGVQAGEGIPELARRVQDVFEGATTYRARRTARTEVIGSSNFANNEALANSGVVNEKSWLSSLDNRVRDAHREAHNQTVKVDKPFIVMGEELEYPGDYRGSAENIVNCRCTEIAESFNE